MNISPAPVSNISDMQFALRLYGQRIGYSTYATDWLPSLFRQHPKIPANKALPYTEPLYESNYGLPSESARGKLRALIIVCYYFNDAKILVSVSRTLDKRESSSI